MHWGYDGWNGVYRYRNDPEYGRQLECLRLPFLPPQPINSMRSSTTAQPGINNSGSDYSASISTGGDTEAPCCLAYRSCRRINGQREYRRQRDCFGTMSVSPKSSFISGEQKLERIQLPRTVSRRTPHLCPTGFYLVKATAYDAAGNSSECIGLISRWDNDITPPSVSFTLDQTASDIKGTFAAAITATDNNAVEKVELFVDNVLQGTDTTAALCRQCGFHLVE